MNEQECAEAVVAWSRDVLPELNEGRPYLSAQKTKLPDVMVDVSEKAIRLSDDRFPDLDIQQAALRIFEVEAAFMVSHADSDIQADATESAALRDFGARLEAAMVTDSTLGARVFMASVVGAITNYRLPFVRYGDGTKGRQMLLSFAAADLVPIQRP